MIKTYGSPIGLQRNSARLISDFLIFCEQTKHLLGINQRLGNLTVHHAEKIQGDIELDHQHVDHHQITDGQLPINDTD